MEPTNYDPLGDATEAHQLGLLAARALGTTRRHLAGSDLDETDRSTLLRVADLVESSGSVVEFFTSLGTSGDAPDAAAASEFDVAIDAVVAAHTSSDEPLIDALQQIATIVRGFEREPTNEVAEQLGEFFMLLGRAAARRTAVVGETVVAV